MASLDIRTIPGFDHKETIANAYRIGKQMEDEDEGLVIEIDVENNRPPLTIDKKNDFIKEIVSVYKT